jgi:hypothetical protein
VYELEGMGFGYSAKEDGVGWKKRWMLTIFTLIELSSEQVSM